MILSFALLLAAAGQTLPSMPPPPPPRPGTVLQRAIKWKCDIRSSEGSSTSVGGMFEAFIADAGRSGSNAKVVFDTSGRFVGDHQAYLGYGEGAGGRSLIRMVISKPDRTYYHFQFNFYGPDKPGSVTIEEQLLGKSPETFRSAGVGYCQMSVVESRDGPSAAGKIQ